MAGAASKQPFWRLRGHGWLLRSTAIFKKNAGYAAFAQLYRVIADP
jgi:hypothetical protein